MTRGHIRRPAISPGLTEAGQSTSRPFVWGHHLRVRSANEDRPVFCVSGSDQRGKPSRLGKVDDVTSASQPVVPLRRRRE